MLMHNIRSTDVLILVKDIPESENVNTPKVGSVTVLKPGGSVTPIVRSERRVGRWRD